MRSRGTFYVSKAKESNIQYSRVDKIAKNNEVRVFKNKEVLKEHSKDKQYKDNNS